MKNNEEVYVVIAYDWSWKYGDDIEIRGVFNSKELARKEREKILKNEKKWQEVVIEGCTLNKPVRIDIETSSGAYGGI